MKKRQTNILKSKTKKSIKKLMVLIKIIKIQNHEKIKGNIRKERVT